MLKVPKLYWLTSPGIAARVIAAPPGMATEGYPVVVEINTVDGMSTDAAKAAAGGTFMAHLIGASGAPRQIDVDECRQ